MKKQWQQSEKKDAKRFGTRQQRGSGNQDFYPTDSYNEYFAIDTKTTNKNSYSLSTATWNKLCEETAVLNAKDNQNRAPLLSLHLRGDHLVVLSFEDFEIMLKQIALWKEFMGND